MYQGTTPVLLFEVEDNLQDCTVQMAFKPMAGDIFIKAAPDVEIYPDEKGTLIMVMFSQEQTFQIPEGVCRVEARWVDKNGRADRADLGAVNVIGSMTKNVITYKGDD